MLNSSWLISANLYQGSIVKLSEISLVCFTKNTLHMLGQSKIAPTAHQSTTCVDEFLCLFLFPLSPSHRASAFIYTVLCQVQQYHCTGYALKQPVQQQLVRQDNPTALQRIHGVASTGQRSALVPFLSCSLSIVRIVVLTRALRLL